MRLLERDRLKKREGRTSTRLSSSSKSDILVLSFEKVLILDWSSVTQQSATFVRSQVSHATGRGETSCWDAPQVTSTASSGSVLRSSWKERPAPPTTSLQVSHPANPPGLFERIERTILGAMFI